MGSGNEGSGSYQAKKIGCDELRSSSVPTRTNLLPSLNLTRGEGGTASVDSDSVFSF